jgi:hypothetical protein
MNIVLPQAHPREAHRDADRKLHLPNRRAQDQHVLGINVCWQHGNVCWQHGNVCWQHVLGRVDVLL